MQDKTPKPRGIALGHLEHDLSFVTRSLRAHLREANAPFFVAHDLAPGQVALLSLIGLNPGVSQKDLAEAVVLKKSALTKSINEMEAAGLIERRKGEGDQRFNTLHLSALGEARVAALSADLKALQARVLGPLDAGEQAQFFAMIWRLLDHFAAERDGL